MSSAAWDVPAGRRSEGRWFGLTVAVLLASCGGERRESPAPGTGAKSASVSDTAAPTVTDTAAPAATDTAAPAATNTAPAAVARDSTAQPQRPAPPATPKPEPAAPTPAPAPAATAPDTGAKVAEEGETQTATAPLRDEYHQAPKDTVDQTTYDGWKQFNLNCARCHGEDVLGSTIAPHLIASLKPDGPVNTQEAFVQVVCAGRPEKGMPSWCALGMDPAKINQIYSYVKGRSEGKIRPGRPAVKPEG
jgi:mono/diheme cytochrome c family protein